MSEFKDTIVDRINALEYDTDNRLAWTVGDIAWKEFSQATGELPRLVDRQKTNGYPGTHKVAAYPEWFVPRLDKIIEEIATVIEAADAKQGRLFRE